MFGNPLGLVNRIQMAGKQAGPAGGKGARTSPKDSALRGPSEGSAGSYSPRSAASAVWTLPGTAGARPSSLPRCAPCPCTSQVGQHVEQGIQQRELTELGKGVAELTQGVVGGSAEFVGKLGRSVLRMMSAVGLASTHTRHGGG